MSRAFEVLDHRSTPLGELMLRRRLEPSLQIDVWEVKLGDEFLMSSQFTATEEAVATLGLEITADPRCRMLQGDFFAVVADGGAALDEPDRFDAALVDIDHAPRRLLAGDHAGFYRAEGLRRVRDLLRDGGVFALWSDDPPDDGFVEVLASVFTAVEANVVSFPNHYTGAESACAVYTAASV